MYCFLLSLKSVYYVQINFDAICCAVAPLGIQIDEFPNAIRKSQLQICHKSDWVLLVSFIGGFLNPLIKNWWIPKNPWNRCRRGHCTLYIIFIKDFKSLHWSLRFENVYENGFWVLIVDCTAAVHCFGAQARTGSIAVEAFWYIWPLTA